MSFEKKVVLITGAGAGIGKAAAEKYAAVGAKVAVNSVSGSGQKVADALAAEGYDVLFVQGDISKAEDAQSMVDRTVEKFGRLDILVNNAGIVAGGNVEEISLEDFERTMQVNVTGTFLMCKYAMPYLRKSRGVIVNVSSVVAVKAVANRAAYSASKGAVLALSKAMAADYLKMGIRVNCICPGTVHTPSLDDRIAASPDPEQAMRDFVARQPMGRLGEAEEIAAAILFASNEDAAFLNGTNIVIDGSMSM